MTRKFSLKAYPTGSFESEVTLTGEFHWSFEPGKTSLTAAEARDVELSRDQYLASTGNLYRFSAKVVDLSTKRVLESMVGDSKGLRDTANLVVRLMAKHNDGQGMVNTILATEELWDPGNRYFEPPLA